MSRQACSGKVERQLFDGDGLALVVAPQAQQGRAAPGPGLRQRPHARRPDAGRRPDAHDVRQAERRHRLAKRRIRPVARVRQHKAARQALRQGLLDQAERDLRLGLENDGVGNTRLFAPTLVLGPFLWQVEAIADRQAGVMMGERKRHRGLAVGPLAKLTAILPRHPDRMPALLGEARVVEIHASIGPRRSSVGRT